VHNSGETYPGDFGEAASFPLAKPDPVWIDGDGRYCEIRKDEWGVVWKQLIFGVAGQPLERPLDDWANLGRYMPPAVPADSGPQFSRQQARAAAHQQKYFLKSGWISIFEVMHAVRRFEDIIVEIARDTPEANRLADLIAERQLAQIRYLLKRGVDAVQFADDFGTQSALMLSPKTFRSFFKPRYASLMKAVRDAGKKVFFHTCGRAYSILEDFVDLGVDAIWPQLNAYDDRELASFCRDARIAIALHPDRGRLMTESTPRQVSKEVERLAETFSASSGGAWFYVEIDAGFPFDNVKALIEAIGRMRDA
jgi:hypothetical protein